MPPALFGIPAHDTDGRGLGTIELGDVIIDTTPAELRSLGRHLIDAANAIEHGLTNIESFTFRDAGPPRNVPSQLIISTSKK